MRNNMIKEQKVFALIKEILSKRNHFFIHCTVIHCTYWLTYMFKPYDSVAAYMGFMWMLLLVAYGQRDPNAYFLIQHIRQSFSQGISDSMSHGNVFTWANTSLLSNLFGEYPGRIL
jgi:polycystin 1L2